jgi:Tol biopolymer transport system component
MHRPLLLLLALCLIAACTPVRSDPSPAPPPRAGAPTAPATAAAPSPLARAHADQIVFQSNREQVAAFYVMNADGTDVRRITSPKQPAFDPTWSPDGRYLAFVNSQLIPNALMRITIDGTEPLQLTSEKANYFLPAWSPDGNWIATNVEHQKTPGIELVRADGSGVTRVITTAIGLRMGFSSPTWAPDSQTLFFTARHEGQTGWYTATLRGETHLITRTTSLDLAPSVSPDGQWIAFASDRDAPGSHGNTAIYLMRADGNVVQPLTAPGHIDTMPSWSPDGTRLAFVSYRDGNSEIYAINRDGTHEARLTNSPANDYRPIWEPAAP